LLNAASDWWEDKTLEGQKLKYHLRITSAGIAFYNL
jgi:hypothetical protein